MNTRLRNKSPSRKKDVPFNIRVSAEEKAAFAEAAGLSGIPVSAWVRERLRWAATKELQMAGKRPAYIQDDAE